MSRLSLEIEELQNALRVALELAEQARREAASQPDPAERERLRGVDQHYSAVAARLERNLLDRTRIRRRRRSIGL